MLDEDLPMNESLSVPAIAFKSKLLLNVKRMKLRMESCKQWVGQIRDDLESRLVAMNAEINALYRMVNRSNLIVIALPEGLNDIPETVINIAELYSVTIALHDISFAGYMKNNKTIVVKLNSIGMRDVLIDKYFKNIRVRPLFVANCVDDPIFTQELRIYPNDHLCSTAGELNKTCANIRKRGRGGNVGLYIALGISFKISFEGFEHVEFGSPLIELDVGAISVLLGVVYLPSGDIKDFENCHLELLIATFSILNFNDSARIVLTLVFWLHYVVLHILMKYGKSVPYFPFVPGVYEFELNLNLGDFILIHGQLEFIEVVIGKL
uniref:Uncharacterized protein n=1 Tax=Glossina austeni TaxID=7395 RepID=A0A1A9VE95_GLOAU